MRFVSRGRSLALGACTLVACGQSVIEVADPVATSIHLSANSIQLETGAQTQLGAEVRDQNGLAMSGVPVTWSVDDDGVASVSSSGVVEGVGVGSTDVHARFQTLEASATVTVSDTPPQPTLSEVVLSPSSASVQVGGTRQFAVEGRLSDGSTTSVSVDWSATGGTISSSGLYTAGSTPGSYQVIATEASSGHADTAAVTVTAAPPPSGFTTLYSLDSFAGQDIYQIFQAANPNDGSMDIIGDWFRQTIPAGATGGWSELHLNGQGGRPDEIGSGTVRWSARVRLSPNFNASLRLLFLAGTPAGDYDAAAGTAGQCPADGKGGNPNRQFFILRSMFSFNEPNFALRYYDQFVSQTGTVLGNCYGVTGEGFGYGTANFQGGDFTPVGGAEFVLMHELVLNTPGVENGAHRIYVNGELRADFPNISFREAGSNVVLSTVGFKPVNSGGNSTGQTIWIEFTDLLLEHDPSAVPQAPPGS